MASENEMKIIFGADTAPLRSEVSKASDSVEKFADDVDKAAKQSVAGFDTLRKSVRGIPEAFDKVANGSVVLSKIAGNLQSAGQAAISSSKAFQSLEGAPLQTISKLDTAIKGVKATLANGFKANLDTSGLSSQAFANVSGQAKELNTVVATLAQTLNLAAIEAKTLGADFQRGFQSGVTEELQRAGVSVAQFKDALDSLTGVGGANLAPLLQVLDAIQAESTGTTTAIKSIGGALQGVSVLAKAPINDLIKLDEELRVIKATLASGFKPSIEKIQINSADFDGVKTAVRGANDSVEHLGDTIRKTAGDSVRAFDSIEKSTQNIPRALDQAAASAGKLSNIESEINSISKTAKIGATQLEKYGEEPLNELKDLEQQLKKVKASMGSGIQLGQIRSASQGYSALAKTVNSAGNATGKLSKESNAASSVLLDLGRVASDLPFGFIGIANNISPLLESFRRLSAESKGVGGFFKNLAGSLVGGGGLGLAFAAVTSAIQIAQYGIMGFGRKTQDASDATQDLAANLKSVAELTSSASGSVAGELAEVNALARGILDVNKSYDERRRMLEALKGVNDAYFGDLTLEESKLKTLTAKVREYSQALIQQAITKKFSDQIADVAINMANATRETDAALKKYEDLQNTISQKFPAGQPKAPSAQTGSLTASVSVSGIDESLAEYNELTRAAEQAEAVFLKNNDTLRKLSLSHADLNDALNKSIENQAKFNSLKPPPDDRKGRIKDAKTEVELLRQRIDALKEIVALERQGMKDDQIFVTDAVLQLKNLEIKLIRAEGKDKGFSEDEINKKIGLLFPEFLGEGLKYTKPVQVTVPIQTKIEVADAVGGEDAAGDGLEAGLKRMHERLVKAGVEAGNKLRQELATPFENLKNSLNTIVADAFMGIADGIGDVLEGKNPVQVFVGVISNALEQLGRALIIFGLAKKFAFKALESLNPMVAIVAGLGAIAAAKLLKAQLAKPAKFAEGGIVRGPTLGMVGESGPEMIIPLNRANQFIDGAGPTQVQVEGILRGQDIYLSHTRFLGSGNRRGGNF